MSDKLKQTKNPISVFFSGLYFAIYMLLFIVVVLLGFDIFTQIVIWKPDFSTDEFYMIKYPLRLDHLSILSAEVIICLFLFLWLGWSIPVYLVTKNKCKDKKDRIETMNDSNIGMNQRIDAIEKSIDGILKRLNTHKPNHLSDNDDQR